MVADRRAGVKINWAIVALAVGAFGIGTTEFAPMGMLPVIAKSLAVSIPTAGLLVSGYALGVLVGAPLLTLPTGGMDRKTLILALMAIFIAGNALSAWAPSYGLLMVARVVTSLCHGAFFGVGSLVAGRLMGEGKAAAGVAAVFSGLTIANIGGVPAAAWVAEHIGWRQAFWGIAGLGVLGFGAMAAALPKTPGQTHLDLAKELSVMRRPAVLLALLTTALGSAAMFTVFTYISPILRDQARASPDAVTIALVIYGVGLTIGNWVGARFADKALTPTLIGVLAALTILLGLFAVTMHSLIPALATVSAWGVATFALVPPLQAKIMSLAKEAPTLASSLNIGAFNLGNAAGAALGGAVIAAGLAYPWVAVAGAAMAAAALVLVVVTRDRSA